MAAHGTALFEVLFLLKTIGFEEVTALVLHYLPVSLNFDIRILLLGQVLKPRELIHCARLLRAIAALHLLSLVLKSGIHKQTAPTRFLGRYCLRNLVVVPCFGRVDDLGEIAAADITAGKYHF